MVARCAALMVTAATLILCSARPAHAGIIGPTVESIGPANPFNESNCPSGDAGDSLSTPCLVTGGPYDGFIGTIGDPDLTDVFGFSWITTGEFTAIYSGIGPVFLSLYEYPSLLFVPSDILSTDTYHVANLLAGNYLFDINVAAVDPPFSIQLFGPEVNPIGSIQQVPEPTTLLLLGAGLSASGARWQHRRRRIGHEQSH